MLLCHQQNGGQIQDIKITNRSFESVSQFKYLGTTDRSTGAVSSRTKATEVLLLIIL
jgi:hypothetical protein